MSAFIFSSPETFVESLLDQYLENKSLVFEENTMDYLFSNEKYDRILDALKRGITLTPKIKRSILLSGDLKLYLYLQTMKSLDLTARTMIHAVKSGNLKTVKWLYRNKCEWSEKVCAYAAKYNQLTILKWLRAHECPWNSMTCINACKYGHLEILQYARANDCPWAYPCNEAVRKGHLNIIIWARENGADWNEWTCNFAVIHQQLEILKYLIGNGCPYNLPYLKEKASTPIIREYLDIL